MTVAGIALVADLSGALFWEQQSLLVVSDLHLEKGSSFAARGVLLPPYDTAATLSRLAAASVLRLALRWPALSVLLIVSLVAARFMPRRPGEIIVRAPAQAQRGKVSGPGDQPAFTADQTNRVNGLIYTANKPSAPGAAASMKMDFRHADRADTYKLNLILWQDAMGKTPPPAALLVRHAKKKDDDDD